MKIIPSFISITFSQAIEPTDSAALLDYGRRLLLVYGKHEKGRGESIVRFGKAMTPVNHARLEVIHKPTRVSRLKYTVYYPFETAVAAALFIFLPLDGNLLFLAPVLLWLSNVAYQLLQEYPRFEKIVKQEMILPEK